MTDLIHVEDLRFVNKKDSFNFFNKTKQFELGPINIDLKAGETLAIIGANGSGKSLLAKLLVGLEKPDSGQIYLHGEALTKSNQRQRCLNIRMIFQNSNESLNPGITLGSILDEPLRLN
ncbi:MAG: ATP-binding cassette domain-containing protein, partial [Paraglaciecola sp.]|nr:ATP-binding cassette domain-containing protein [Paraglaciecola sp.]